MSDRLPRGWPSHANPELIGSLCVFTLPVAVLAHEIPELVVIANGIRMARA